MENQLIKMIETLELNLIKSTYSVQSCDYTLFWELSDKSANYGLQIYSPFWAASIRVL